MRKISAINFKSSWIEKCVHTTLNKLEGSLSMEDIRKIKYMKIEEDSIIELSAMTPSQPFVAFDGGDEWWACCFLPKKKDGLFSMKDYVIYNGNIFIDHKKVPDWNYAISEEAEEKWDVFEKEVIKFNIYKEQKSMLLEDDTDFLPIEDLQKFSGLEVLRLYARELSDFTFFRSFPNLRALELFEVCVQKEEGLNELSRLEQLCCWLD